MVWMVVPGGIASVECGRKRCRRCALPPQSKTLWVAGCIERRSTGGYARLLRITDPRSKNADASLLPLL